MYTNKHKKHFNDTILFYAHTLVLGMKGSKKFSVTMYSKHDRTNKSYLSTMEIRGLLSNHAHMNYFIAKELTDVRFKPKQVRRQRLALR